ncbi:hypothetical protein PN451_04565 [Dolichospermum planctonicum CS-1226]|uniref:Uncharacterized protein n=1 Tax=Dolichospermum planctonicum CS-1226 TaxID=3021751 RepID=A0ABT5ADV4_9CYAN|nr:hypothetical protein [Dolichospermum planctonicum]MDB9535127.1 hypothetical protein [Dolichospermum planctonicum CS-1226]
MSDNTPTNNFHVFIGIFTGFSCRPWFLGLATSSSELVSGAITATVQFSFPENDEYQTAA